MAGGQRVFGINKGLWVFVASRCVVFADVQEPHLMAWLANQRLRFLAIPSQISTKELSQLQARDSKRISTPSTRQLTKELMAVGGFEARAMNLISVFLRSEGTVAELGALPSATCRGW